MAPKVPLPKPLGLVKKVVNNSTKITTATAAETYSTRFSKPSGSHLARCALFSNSHHRYSPPTAASATITTCATMNAEGERTPSGS